MLFTKECDYGIRIVRALAGGQLMTVQDISSVEDISIHNTYKIARKLEKSGVIVSHRGKNGGYSIGKPVKDLSLFEVCSAIDPEVLITECVAHSHECSRNTRGHVCQVHGEFCRLQNIIIQELKSKTMADVLGR